LADRVGTKDGSELVLGIIDKLRWEEGIVLAEGTKLSLPSLLGTKELTIVGISLDGMVWEGTAVFVGATEGCSLVVGKIDALGSEEGEISLNVGYALLLG